jgi:uncharacterized protein (TIGR00106 family)
MPLRSSKAQGLDYRLGPLSTAVEGNWDQVLGAVRRCHEAVAQVHDRVVTSILIDDRKTQSHYLREMITSVEQQLGHTTKR